MKTDLNAVAVFLKVVEMQSFRAAARALELPKSTVSLKLAQLEDRLGVRLLERTTRSLHLTDAGAAYHRQLVPAFDALNEAERAVTELQSSPSGRLRITTTVEFGQYSGVVSDVLAEYLRLYPAVELAVELSDRRVNLIEEGFDVAIRAGVLEDSTLIARRLGSGGTFRIYASPSYLRERGVPKRPSDLASHDCMVMTNQSHPTNWQFRGKRKPIVVGIRPRLAVNSFLVLRAVTVAGRGLARLPAYIGDPLCESGALTTVLDDFALPAWQWHAVYPSARNLSPKVRALIDLLERRFATWPAERGTASVPA